ncbi:MAG: ABC transporter permease [Bacteroidales bacterium]|nr:ABC transporter permease [Bacteroidales bacterium]
MIFIRLLKESFEFAVQAIIVNKLRTILTLLGITIGIFSVISVFTVVDSLEHKIESSIENLGSNVVYIQKWPWEFSMDFPWWKYVDRPVAKVKESDEIIKRSQLAEAVTFMMSTNKKVQYESVISENTSIMGVMQDFDKTWAFSIDEGRYFTETELLNGRNVAIMGPEIAKILFSTISPLNREIRIWGAKIEVIGLFQKKGEDGFGESTDKLIVLPARFVANYEIIDSEMNNPMIVVKANKGIPNADLSEELRGILRSVRKLKPYQEDNFAINEANMINKGFEQLFSILSIAGWFIGLFSLLVGGFGIANIMFVSVVERTNQIGIQKSLGAKRFFILSQFLFEAVFLSLIGGSFGLILIFLGTLASTYLLDFPISLYGSNILLGLFVSFIIGIVSGFVPAYKASVLDPVEAIRQGG